MTARDQTATDDDAAELIAQLRELAGADPADVRQVVAEVLAALREHLPEAIRLDAGLGPATPARS
jgi:molybdopterin converting factor small subunit